MKDTLPISQSKLTIERVREMLHYDCNTGILTWLKKSAKNTIIGSRAGSQKSVF